uniref:Cytochrome c oxidase subunit n=1 Tax=Clastoptera arizonana TaxID=38151 RepID=A0A1B6DGY2_9HEMI
MSKNTNKNCSEDSEEKVETRNQKREYAELKTCEPDPRFQQQNVTNWCYRMYVDYHRCVDLLKDDQNQCQYFYKCFHSICPNDWIAKWDGQIEKGTFPGIYKGRTRIISSMKKCKDKTSF